VINYPD